ncbi:unnamed protein product, partial [Ectocarpus sp. 8 AP-2014]
MAPVVRHLKRPAFLRKGPFRQAQLAQRNMWQVFGCDFSAPPVSPSWCPVRSPNVNSVRSARTQSPGIYTHAPFGPNTRRDCRKTKQLATSLSAHRHKRAKDEKDEGGGSPPQQGGGLQALPLPTAKKTHPKTITSPG